MSVSGEHPKVEREAPPPGRARIRVPAGLTRTLAGRRARISSHRRAGSPSAGPTPRWNADWQRQLVPVAVVSAMALNAVLISAVPASSAADTSRTSTPTSGEPTRLHALARLVLSPARDSRLTGARLAYAAEGYDAAGHDLGNVTALAQFSISPEGYCTQSRCAAREPGPHTVTGTIHRKNRTIRGTAALLVVRPASPGNPQPAAHQPAPDPSHGSRGVAQPGHPATRQPAGRPLPRAHLVLTPARAFVPSGGSITYTAVAYDDAGHTLGDVTGSTRFAIGFSGERNSFLIRPNGSCAAATCTATKLGRHTVTGTFQLGDRTISGDAAVQVVPRRHAVKPPHQLASLELHPSSAVIESGANITYTADGYDAAHHFLGDLTAFTSFSISPLGSCHLATCTSTKLGQHAVTGTIDLRNRRVIGVATLLVVPRLAGLRLKPRKALIELGQAVTYEAFGLNAKGHPVVNLTDFTSFSIPPPGLCAGNTCTAEKPGRYIVTGTVGLGDRTLSGHAHLRVVPHVDLELRPVSATITAGHFIVYRAVGVDEADNPVVNLTSYTRFSITPPGSCAKATCTSTKAGEYRVTGTVKIGDRTLTSTVTLRVVAGALTRLRLLPERARIVAGHHQAYLARGFDAYGNPLGGITARTSFSISPDGSCTGAVCAATRRGRHTVAGTVQTRSGPVAGTAILDVVPGPLVNLILRPPHAKIKAGGSRAYRARGFDAYGNALGNLTARTKFSISPNGSCSGAVCTATRPGRHIVTATATARGGQAMARATLDVVSVVGPKRPLIILRLRPRSTVVFAGGSVSYTATGSDADGTRHVNLTGRTHFSVGATSCDGTKCTPSTLGWHTVLGTATIGTHVLTGRARLLVVSTPIVDLRLNPRSAAIRTGGRVTYTVAGRDAAHHVIADLTAVSTLSVTPDGSCTGAICTASKRGKHTVTATVDIQNRRLTGTATLWVGSGSKGPPGRQLVSLELDPRSAVVDAGARVTFFATEVAANGSGLGDFTGGTRFSISPDGSCSGATCSPAKPGEHTVTGTLTRGNRHLTATATLQARVTLVSCMLSRGDAHHLTVTPNRAAAGTPLKITATLNRKFAGCPVATLLGGAQSGGVFKVGPNGGISAQGTIPSNIPPGTTTVKLARADGGIIATLRFAVLAKPLPHPGHRWLLWLAAAVAALLLLLLAALALSGHRARRQRRWVHQHVRTEPHSRPSQVKADRDTAAAPTISVRLQPHGGEGKTEIQKEGN